MSGPLQEVLDLKGKGLHAPVSQALSILLVSRSLSLTVGHLPSEANTEADALSRQSEPNNLLPWPFSRAQAVQVDEAVRPSTLWSWLGRRPVRGMRRPGSPQAAG